MLGKLIKHEWKSTYKICCVMLIFLAVMTILGCLSFRTQFWSEAFKGNDVNNLTILDYSGILMLVFYVIAIIGVICGSLIYIAVHFYKGLYSEEGYLTHTLPVSSHEILISRLLVGSCWYIIICIMAILSIVILVYSVMAIAFSVTESGSLLSYIIANRDSIFASIRESYNIESWSYVFWSIPSMIISTVYSIMTILGALTLGQLSGKHKVMMSIVSYFAITVVQSLINNIILLPVMLTASMNNGNSFGWNNLTIVLNVVITVVLYFLSYFIITKKLNLE